MNQKKAGKEASSSARGDHTAIAHRAVVRVRDSAVAAGPLDQAGGGRGGGVRAASHAAQGDWLTLAGHNGGHSIYSNDLWDPGELLPQYRRFPSQSLTLLSSLFASLPPPLHLPSLPERTDHPQICTWGCFDMQPQQLLSLLPHFRAGGLCWPPCRTSVLHTNPCFR